MNLYVIEGSVKDNYVRKGVIASNQEEACNIAKIYGFEWVSVVSLVAETSERTARIL